VVLFQIDPATPNPISGCVGRWRSWFLSMPPPPVKDWRKRASAAPVACVASAADELVGSNGREVLLVADTAAATVPSGDGQLPWRLML